MEGVPPGYSTVNWGEFEERGEFGHCKLFESTANNFVHIVQIM